MTPSIEPFSSKAIFVMRRKGFRLPYHSVKEAPQESPDNEKSPSASRDPTKKSVKLIFTKKGDRDSVMVKLRNKSALETFATDTEFTSAVTEESKAEHHAHKKLSHAPMFVPMSVDDDAFEHDDKIESDFLHHADDLLHMVLELPHGFHPRPIEEDLKDKTPLQISLLGLPGGLTLTPDVSHKYFGEDSRLNFFDRFHWLSYQRNLVGGLGTHHGTEEDEDEASNDDIVDLAPGQELVFDQISSAELRIPFAPRRPHQEDEDDEDALPSFSQMRAASRSTVLTEKAQRIPTLNEILGSDSNVLAIMAAKRAEEAAAKAAAEEAAAKQAKRATVSGARAAAREAAKTGVKPSSRVAIPKLPSLELTAGSSVLASLMAQPQSTYTGPALLKRPLSPKTAATIVQLRDPKVIEDLSSTAALRLRAMTSEENVSEDVRKLEQISDSARRKQREQIEQERLKKMRERLKATIDLWQHQSTNKDDPTEQPKVKEEVLIIKTEHVDVKPVKYVPGTRGKRLAVSKVKDSTKEQKDGPQPKEAKGVIEGKELSKTKAAAKGGQSSSLQVEVPNRSATAPKSAGRRETIKPSGKDSPVPSEGSVDQKRRRAMSTKSMKSSKAPLQPSEPSPTLDDSFAGAHNSTFSIRGMLVGPGGVLDESRFGCSQDEDDEFEFPIPVIRLSDDMSAAPSLGLDTAMMESRLHDVEEADEAFVPASPRTVYISGCMKHGLNPRASLVLRRSLTKKLELQHQGMGDDMAMVLAESLKNLPFIQAINLTDNRLTDEGLKPLLKAALSIPGLLELNLSQNEIGPGAAEELFNYLCWEECPLQKLVLANADVDDGECASFIEAVKANRSLKELVMSNNKIGEAENYNTVFPDFTTGGEAIADLLRDEACHIECLRLDWNKIRLDSGIQIADSLAVNHALTFLDLSYNSLGHDGGIALGRSIESNSALKTLMVTNNALDAAACVTICAGVIENKNISNIYIDGNPIGIQGSKALMLVPMVTGSRVRISASRCNISLKDPSCPYDFDNLLRSYELDMENAFERAVLMLLMHLIAAHHTYVFSKFDYAVTARGKSSASANNKKANAQNTRVKVLELIQSSSFERMQFFDESQHTVLNNLKKIQEAAGDFQTAISLFTEIDKDGSGELDKEELGQLMRSIGLEMSQKRIDEVMYTYDVDGGGNIEIPEFLAFLKSQYYEADARIKDLCQLPIIALRTAPTTRYIPPNVGKMNFSINNLFTRKKILRIMSSCDRDYITDVSNGAGVDTIAMISQGLQSCMMRLDEGLAMFDMMMCETRHKINVLCKILPQMADPMDAKQLVAAALNYNKAEVLQLKRAMRFALKPILGDPNGYYILDMADDMDRLCVTRLLEISKTTARNKSEKSKIGYGLIGDLSQHGNWSCFRNELFNGKQFILTLQFANPLPTTGKLEFDFSAGSRPPRDCMVISDNRITQVLINHFMLSAERRQAAMDRLQIHKKMGELSLDCDGHTAFAPTLQRASATAIHMDKFYEKLPLRSAQYESQADSEKVGTLKENEKTSRLIDPAFEEDDTEDQNSFRVMGYGGGFVDGGSTASYTIEDDSSVSHSVQDSVFSEALQSLLEAPDDGSLYDIPEDEVIEPSSPSAKATSAKKKAAVLDINVDDLVEEDDNDKVVESGQEFMQKFGRLLESRTASIGMKARRIIDVLQDVLSRSYLLSRHLALIIDCFRPFGEKKSTEFFGTYNIELIIAFFDKIVDMHNFDLVLSRLSAFEVACLYCRLGILSIYNPAKPEGGWELNLGRWEERVVAKTMCLLATVEPGENWIGETFRHSRSMDVVPGWELVQLWLTDEGMSRKGILTLEYYSGECEFKNCCRPNINLRKSLFNLVLIDEAELVEEGLRDREQVLQGDKAIRANLPMWTNYLAIPKESDEKIAADFEKRLKFDEFAGEQIKVAKSDKQKKK